MEPADQKRLHHEQLIRKLLRARNTKPARKWLSEASPDVERTLGESGSTAEAVRLIDKVYKLGAVNVHVAKICTYDGGENGGRLVVELPRDPATRRRLFKWEEQMAHAVGYDGEEDWGQQHLFIMLD